MSLHEKIVALYPDLTDRDFLPWLHIIVLQDDGDGKGAYIREWNHPTLPRPTDEQLAGVN